MATDIQLLRGTDTRRAASTKVLEAGQPFFCTDTRTLYIGDGSNQLKNLDPITVDLREVDGTLAVSNGGTGQTTLALARNAMGLGNTTEALPLANGGTGANTAAAARSNLGAASTAAATTSANGLMTGADKSKLNGIATGAQVNVQSDWAVTSKSADAYIKNKPTSLPPSGAAGGDLSENYPKPSVSQLNGQSITSIFETNSAKVKNATSSDSCTGNAATATKLKATKTIKTNLASTSAASFDGSTNVTPGVSGTLPVANGGTGQTTLAQVKVGSATSADSADAANTVQITTRGSAEGHPILFTTNGPDGNPQSGLKSIYQATDNDFAYDPHTSALSIPIIKIGSWTISEAGSTLQFKYNGTVRMTLTNSGILDVT